MTKPRSRRLFIAAAVTSLLFVAAVVLGSVLPGVIRSDIATHISYLISMSDPSSPTFIGWKNSSNIYSDLGVFTVSLFNITNPYNISANSIPLLSEIPPVTFWLMESKNNIRLEHNLSDLVFTTSKYYISWENDGDPYADCISPLLTEDQCHYKRTILDLEAKGNGRSASKLDSTIFTLYMPLITLVIATYGYTDYPSMTSERLSRVLVTGCVGDESYGSPSELMPTDSLNCTLTMNELKGALYLRSVLSSLLPHDDDDSSGDNPFIAELSIRDAVFGYPDPIFEALNALEPGFPSYYPGIVLNTTIGVINTTDVITDDDSSSPMPIPIVEDSVKSVPFDPYGYGSSPVPYSGYQVASTHMHTGAVNPSLLRSLYSWDGMNSLQCCLWGPCGPNTNYSNMLTHQHPAWGAPWANDLDGTYLDGFSPEVLEAVLSLSPDNYPLIASSTTNIVPSSSNSSNSMEFDSDSGSNSSISHKPMHLATLGMQVFIPEMVRSVTLVPSNIAAAQSVILGFQSGNVSPSSSLLQKGDVSALSSNISAEMMVFPPTYSPSILASFYSEIPSQRLALLPSSLLNTVSNPRNAAFFATANTANGVINQTSCSLGGMPFFFSKPYFLGGNSSQLNAPMRLPQGIESIHDSFFDVFAPTGRILGRQWRMQQSILSSVIPVFSQLFGPNVYIPLLWTDSSILAASAVRADIQQNILYPERVASHVRTVGVVAAVLCGVTAVLLSLAGFVLYKGEIVAALASRDRSDLKEALLEEEVLRKKQNSVIFKFSNFVRNYARLSESSLSEPSSTRASLSSEDDQGRVDFAPELILRDPVTVTSSPTLTHSVNHLFLEEAESYRFHSDDSDLVRKLEEDLDALIGGTGVSRL